VSWGSRSKIPLFIIVASPLILIPWVSSNEALILISLTFISALLIKFGTRASIIMSFITLTYGIVTSYHGFGSALAFSLFALGLALLGWIPKSGALEAVFWWFLISLPISLIFIFYNIGPSEGAYLMLLLIVTASVASYYINPPGIRSLLAYKTSTRPSEVNLAKVGSRIFEIIFYILLIYAGVHINKAAEGLLSAFIGLILRKFTDTKWSMLISSFLFLLFQYFL